MGRERGLPRTGEVYASGVNSRRVSMVFALAVALVVAFPPPVFAPPADAPKGQITIAVNVTLAPRGSIPPRRPGSSPRS
jgi:hypothetical protein